MDRHLSKPINFVTEDFYFGRGAGKDIFRNLMLLNSGDSVTIITPFFTRIFASKDWRKDKSFSYPRDGDILLHLLRNNVTVNLITSELFNEKNLFEKTEVENEETFIKTVNDYTGYIKKVKDFKNLEIFLWAILTGLFFSSGIFSVLFKIFLLVTLIFIRKLRLDEIPKKNIEEKKKEFYSLNELKKHYESYVEFENKNFNLFLNDEILHSKIFILNDSLVYTGSINFTFQGFIKNYETRFKITDREKIVEFTNLAEELKNNSRKQNLSEILVSMGDFGVVLEKMYKGYC